MFSENTIAQLLFGHDLPLDAGEKETVKEYANTFNALKLRSIPDGWWNDDLKDHQSLSE